MESDLVYFGYLCIAGRRAFGALVGARKVAH